MFVAVTNISCSVPSYEKDGVIAMEITIWGVFLGSSDCPFEVKEVVFIPEKSSHLSRLGAPFS